MKDNQYLERRNFFRVNDQAIVSCKSIDEEEKIEGIQRLKADKLEMPDISRLFFTLETEFQDKLMQIRDSNLKGALDLINRKINLLTKGGVVNSEYHSLFSHSPEPVSLSASGFSYLSEEPVSVGTDCQIELVLMPSKSYLFAYGQVKNCVDWPLPGDERSIDDGKNYRIGLIFDYMREEDMERLIQHIMRVEAQLIRQARANE